MSLEAHVCPGYGQVASRAAGPKTPRRVTPSGSNATVPSLVQCPVDVSTTVSPFLAYTPAEQWSHNGWPASTGGSYTGVVRCRVSAGRRTTIATSAIAKTTRYKAYRL